MGGDDVDNPDLKNDQESDDDIDDETDFIPDKDGNVVKIDENTLPFDETPEKKKEDFHIKKGVDELDEQQFQSFEHWAELFGVLTFILAIIAIDLFCCTNENKIEIPYYLVDQNAEAQAEKNDGKDLYKKQKDEDMENRHEQKLNTAIN